MNSSIFAGSPRWLRLVPAILAVAFATGLQAQITPSLSCVSNAGTTPLSRWEGTAELAGDIVLNCTGGSPTVAGARVPVVNITVFLTSQITNREVAPQITDALVILDDPAPAKQVACVPAGTDATCFVTGTGVGVNFRQGAAPNVFQAVRTSASSVEFRGIPVDPPGLSATRSIRITNLRFNATAIGTSTWIVPNSAKAYLAVSPPQFLPLNTPELTVAFVANGLDFSLRTAADDAALPASGKALQQCVTLNQSTAADPMKPLTDGATFIARFKEGFASAFRRRNIALTTNSDVLPGPLAQDAPGGVCSQGSTPPSVTSCPANSYFTETGFYNPAFPATKGLNVAGLATQGTRLMLRFTGLPAGVVPMVGLYENGRTAANSRIRLVNTSGSPVAATGTSPFAFAPVAMSQGSGSAVWEVLSSDPLATETIDVPVAISYGAGVLPGYVSVIGSLGPVGSDTAAAPRFFDESATKTGGVISPCATCMSISTLTKHHSLNAEVGQVQVTAPQSCAYTAASDSPWLSVGPMGAGVVNYAVAANPSGPRMGSLLIGNQTVAVQQAGQPTCTYSLSELTLNSSSGAVNVQSNCSWYARTDTNTIVITSNGSGSGNGTIRFSIAGAYASGKIIVGTASVAINQSVSATSGLRFVPVAPCRIVDTRPNQGTTGAFGPLALNAGETRSFPFPQGRCNLPANALAYSVNVTVVPQGVLQYLTLWPTGGSQPYVSTLNSFTGDVAANAAIVPAGTNGAVSVYVTDKTDVLIDVNGYFIAPDAAPIGTNALNFYPSNPCRVVDTRAAQYYYGDFGPPALTAGSKRDIPIPLSFCGIPSYAKAYAVNITVVPSQPLAYLTTWPTGSAKPLVSTLNSFKGRVVANAAIVPAGWNGAISVFVANSTDLIIDINGYFAEGS